MKKLIISLSIIFLFVFTFIPKTKAYTMHPLDYIESFDITISTRSDATLDLEYNIKWLVIANDSDGNGVTWVKIGVPNKHVDEVKSLSSDVKKSYYKYDRGSFTIRCDLKREYRPGETIDIRFSYHLTHIFSFDKDGSKDLVGYSFVPGWFDDILVGRVTVKWYSLNNYFNDATDLDGNYLVWEEYNLKQGQRMNPCNISYEKSNFPNINEKASYDDSKDIKGIILEYLPLFIIALIIIIVLVICKLAYRSSYYHTRGFYPARRRFMFRPYYYGVNSSGTPVSTTGVSRASAGSHSGHSCACACACACAGGGRAGCSKKDFYKNKIDIEEFEKELNKGRG